MLKTSYPYYLAGQPVAANQDLEVTDKYTGEVETDRLQAKPKVMIIGEFWAMTTEGDGNYHLQRFLESEGAEVDIQLLTAWLLYMIWQGKHDTLRRMELRGEDEGRKGLAGKNARRRLWILCRGR